MQRDGIVKSVEELIPQRGAAHRALLSPRKWPSNELREEVRHVQMAPSSFGRGLIGSEPLLIVGRKCLRADDLKGLIGRLKSNPDKPSVGIAGVGAAGHLTGISFQRETGTRFPVRAVLSDDLGIPITALDQQPPRPCAPIMKPSPSAGGPSSGPPASR